MTFKLQPKATSIYCLSIGADIFSDESALLSQISPYRAQKAKKFYKRCDRLLCIAVGILLNTVFGADSAKAEQSDELGKPFIPNMPPFSISHSGEYAVIAVAGGGGKIGIDIEKRLDADYMSLAGIAFCPEERDKLAKYCGEAQRELFYDIWVCKESYVKALGSGFLREPKSFSVKRVSENQYEAENTSIKLIDLSGYSLALCAQDAYTVSNINFIGVKHENN